MKKTICIFSAFFLCVNLFAIEGTFVTENLRMRSSPDLSGEVICTLQAGTEIQTVKGYYGDHTHSEKIDEIDGKKAYWYQIETIDGTKDKNGNNVVAGKRGWVFGGYLKSIIENRNPKYPEFPIIHTFEFFENAEHNVYVKYNNDQIILRTLTSDDNPTLYIGVGLQASFKTDTGYIIIFICGGEHPGPNHVYFVDFNSKQSQYISTCYKDGYERSCEVYYNKENNTERIVIYSEDAMGIDENGNYLFDIFKKGIFEITKDNTIKILDESLFEKYYERAKEGDKAFTRIFY